MLLVGGAAAVRGQTVAVTNLNDSGAGSLRQAIADVPAGGHVTFAVSGTIVLTSAELTIGKNLFIDGPGASLLSVSGNNARRVFNVTAGTVEINGISIIRGETSGNGAGVQTASGVNLTMNECVVGGSGLGSHASGFGGGLYNAFGATATVNRSAFIGNSAFPNGGASGGGIANVGTTNVNNSTFTDNSTRHGGGAIWTENACVLNVQSCTISGNSATTGGVGLGGGIRTQNGTATTINNTIVSGNTATLGSPDVAGSFSGGFNLIGGSPLLGPLQDNGGPTPTMALAPTSPAMDKGHAGGLTTDQRGRIRPYDIPTIANAAGGDGSDIGAVELGCAAPPSGMVGWWQWEGNGNDIQGTNPATFVGSPAFISGEVGQALQLNGTTQYARTNAASPGLNVGGGSGMTIDLWINPSDVSAQRPLVEWNAGNGVGNNQGDAGIGAHLWIGTGGPGSLGVNLRDVTGTNHVVVSAQNLIMANQWQHVAVTYNRTFPGETKLYINGVVVQTGTFGVITPMTNYPLWFGARTAPTDIKYSGALDEIEVFDRAVSDGEIAAIYNAGNAGKCPVGRIQLSAGTYSADEGAGSASIIVKRTDGSYGAASVTFDTSNGTATAGSDYTAVTSFTVNFADGDAADKTVPITIANDTLFENNETVNIALTSATGALLGPQNTAVLTITDNDTVPTFSIDDVEHNEGNTGATNYVFTVTKTGSTGLNATVDFMTQNGSATTGDDDYEDNTGTLTFAPGDTTMEITVQANGDAKFEPPETFAVTLTNPTGATISDASGTGTLANDDAAPVIQFDQTTASVDEDDGSVSLTVKRTVNTAGPVSVQYSLGGGTATPGADYDATAGQVDFADGEDTKNITVTINNDTAHELNETFGVTLSSPSGAVLGTNDMATVTIVPDGDGVPVVTNTNDAGAGSLRQAIADALDGDDVSFNAVAFAAAGGPYTITLSTGEIAINNSITLTGPTVAQVIVNGGGTSRVFSVSSGRIVAISNLNITGGFVASGCGGGIRNDHGTLTLTGVTISGNSADQGAGICNFGSGSASPTTLTVINSTISGNTASGQGGGISNQGQNLGNVVLTVVNSTLAGNTATSGAGVFNYGFNSGNGVFTTKNTIYANSAFGTNIESVINDGTGGVTSMGYNLSDDNGGGFLTGSEDQINTAPLLGPLRDNGGPTLTHAPESGSPAVDKGKNFAVDGNNDPILTDQRGSTRPFDNPAISNATGGDGSDIGAFETGAVSFSSATYAVSEPAGEAVITLQRTGGAFGRVSAKVTFTDVTTSPADYLLTPGLLDASFNAGGAGANGDGLALAVQPDGKIIVGGGFNIYNGNGTAPDRVLRLDADGTRDTSFNASGAGANNTVSAVALQPDSKILVGGNFTSYNSDAAAPDRVLRLNADGTRDSAFNLGGAGADAEVRALVVQPDGKIIVGGNFTDYNNDAAAPDCVLRLNADGTLDTTFNPGGAGANAEVRALVLQPDGKIIVGGNFSDYNGGAAPDRVLRLNANGSLDTTFNSGGAGASNNVLALALQPDGKIIVGGHFSSYNGAAAAPNFVLRLNADGALDSSFNMGGTGASSTVVAVALQGDGKILVGGSFTSYNNDAAAPDNMLRLNADGTRDATFNPGGAGTDTIVSSLALQPDGRVLAGGNFIEYRRYGGS